MLHYQPYTGSAGPEEAQIHNNNLVFFHVLASMGIESKMETLEEPAGVEVVEFQLDGNYYTVGYDRWGYNCDQTSDLDQASLEITIMWLFDRLSESSRD